MYPIPCPYCNSIQKLRNVTKYEGKTVKLACKNLDCLRSFEHTVSIPKKGTSGTLVVLDDTIGSKARLSYQGHNKMQTCILDSSAYVVGRKSSSSDADILLAVRDPNMSRKHCKIQSVPYREGLLFSISDLGSKNGVLVNNRLLKDAEVVFLVDGDEITLGQTTITFNYVP